jgi:hypothetical protein
MESSVAVELWSGSLWFLSWNQQGCCKRDNHLRGGGGKAEGVEVFGCGISRGIPVVRDIA